MPIIFVPGRGYIEFPDDMTPYQIDLAIKQSVIPGKPLPQLKAPKQPEPSVINFLKGVGENVMVGVEKAREYASQITPGEYIESGIVNAGRLLAAPQIIQNKMFEMAGIAPKAPPLPPRQGPRISERIDEAIGLGSPQERARRAAEEARRAQIYGAAAVRSPGEQRRLSQQAEAAAAKPEFESILGEGLYSGATSLAQMAPGLALSVLTRNPAPALASAGALSAADQYYNVLDRGGTRQEALDAAQLTGATEVATELLPMGVVVNSLGKVGVLKFLRQYLGKELPTELVATITQNAIDTAIANPEKTWAEYLNELPRDLATTAIATLVPSATFATVGKGLEIAARRSGQLPAETGAAETRAAAGLPPAPPPPPPPADFARRLGPVGGTVSIQEPSGIRAYRFDGFDEDGNVLLTDEDGLTYADDPAEVAQMMVSGQPAAPAAAAPAAPAATGAPPATAFGMDITEGLPEPKTAQNKIDEVLDRLAKQEAEDAQAEAELRAEIEGRKAAEAPTAPAESIAPAAIFDARNGENALSQEELLDQLDFLQELADRGKLTPKRLAASAFGRTQPTNTMMALNRAIASDPVETIRSLRERAEATAPEAPVAPTESIAPPETKTLPVDKDVASYMDEYSRFRTAEQMDRIMSIASDIARSQGKRSISRDALFKAGMQFDDELAAQGRPAPKQAPAPAQPVQMSPEDAKELADEQDFLDRLEGDLAYIAENRAENWYEGEDPDTKAAYEEEIAALEASRQERIRNIEAIKAKYAAPAAEPAPAAGAVGADAGNGFFINGNAGKSRIVTDVSLRGAVMVDKRSEMGEPSSFYMGKDGNLIDSANVNFVNPSTLQNIWTNGTEDQRAQVADLLRQAQLLPVGDPARKPIMDQIKQIVVGSQAAAAQPEAAQPEATQPEAAGAPVAPAAAEDVLSGLQRIMGRFHPQLREMFMLPQIQEKIASGQTLTVDDIPDALKRNIPSADRILVARALTENPQQVIDVANSVPFTTPAGDVVYPTAAQAEAAPEAAGIEAPSPKNTQTKSRVGNVIFDQENGVGQVGNNQNINYFGFTAMMRPSKFLELASDLEEPKQRSLDYIRKSIEEGKGVGSPFLTVEIETGKVKGHEGRHRMMVIQEVNGDQPVPVHIFVRGEQREQRAKDLDEGKIANLRSRLISEDGKESSDNFSEAFLQGNVVPAAAPATTPEEAPLKPPIQVGKKARATIPTTREKVEVQYELHDLDNMRFAEGELQNRDRSREQTKQFLRRFVAKFDPEGLGEDKSTDRGAPIINKENVILSGNGRTLGLEEIYDKHPEQADAYRDFLREEGWNVDGVNRPILVRRLLSDVAERQFVVGSNEPDIAALSPPELAAQDATDILTPETMSKFNGGDLKLAANDKFVSEFISKLSDQQRENAMDAKGNVSAQILQRIKNALLYKAFGGGGRASDIFISKAMERSDDDTKALTNALVDASNDWIKFKTGIANGKIDPKYDITDKILEAVAAISDIKTGKKMKVAYYLRSEDLIDPLDPFVKKILLAFHDEKVTRFRSKKAIAELLRDYAEEAATKQAQPDMLGKAYTPSAEDIWNDVDRAQAPSEQEQEDEESPRLLESITTTQGGDQQTEIVEQAATIPSLSRKVRKYRKQYEEGKIDAQEFAYLVADWSAYIDDLKRQQQWDKLIAPRARGADFIRQKMLEAKRRGDISAEELEFAEWFILRNPALLEDLGISIKQPSKPGVSGDYDRVARVMRLFKGATNDTTSVHEILHHTERMMPADLQEAIRTSWKKSFQAAAKKADNRQTELFFEALQAFHDKKEFKIGDLTFPASEGMPAALRLLKEGQVPMSNYQFVTPSEFWAVNATDIVKGQYDVKGSLLGRLRNWLRGLAEKAKDLFGLPSNAPIIRALESLANSDGTFVSKSMLQKKAVMFNDEKVVPINAKRLAEIMEVARAVANDPKIANLRQIDGLIDLLDEVYASPDVELSNEAARIQDQLMDLEDRLRASKTPLNDNVLETEVQKAEREYDKIRDEYNKFFYNPDDERMFADGRSREFKAWRKESDALEAKLQEAGKRFEELYRQETDRLYGEVKHGSADEMKKAVAKGQEQDDKIMQERSNLQEKNRGCD